MAENLVVTQIFKKLLPLFSIKQLGTVFNSSQMNPVHIRQSIPLKSVSLFFQLHLSSLSHPVASGFLTEVWHVLTYSTCATCPAQSPSLFHYKKILRTRSTNILRNRAR